MLKREGWRDNHKRIYRLYREQGLSLRLKLPRRIISAEQGILNQLFGYEQIKS